MANVFYPVKLYSTKEDGTVYGVLKEMDDDREIKIAFCSPSIDQLAADLSESLHREYHKIEKMVIGLDYQVPVMRVVIADHQKGTVDTLSVLDLEQDEMTQFEKSLGRHLEKAMVKVMRKDID